MCLAAGAGCTSSSTDSPTGTSTSAILEGQVTGGTATTKVAASQIGSDGKLTALVDTPVDVDADGHYSLPATVAAGSTNNQLIITATGASGTVLGSVVVEGAFAPKSTVQVNPIDNQSTSVANLLVSAKSSGQWGADYTFAELRALLSDGTAGVIASTQANLTVASVDGVSAITAWRNMLAAQGFTAADNATELLNLQAAEATLDTQLDAASTDAEKQAAATTYFAAFIKSNLDAGATQEELAATSSATADVMAVYATSMDTDNKANVLARAELLRASQVTSAVSADMESLGATSDAQAAATTAGTTLQTQIAAAAQAGDGAKAAISSAWTLYGTTVKALLTTSLMMGDATLLGAVNDAIAIDLSALSTAKSTLSSTATVADTASAESKAFLQYMTSGLTHSALLTASGVTDAHAAAYLNGMLLIDAAAGAESS